MITLKNINLSSIDLSGIDLRGIKLGLGGRGGGSGDGFPQLPGDVTRWHFGGLTNEMMAAMDDPRIEDADHKGRFLSFKNFAWGGMSGVGGYGDENHQTFYKFTLDDYVFIATPPGVKHMNFTFRVTGLQPGNKLTLAFFGTTNTVYGTWNKDGIYTVDADIVEAGKPTYFYNGYSATRGEFTIEILPLYPGALVFDGVDDYGACDNFPILTKEKGYTVVALRQWITYNPNAISAIATNASDQSFNGAFTFENYNKGAEQTISYGATQISLQYSKSPFSWQTTSKYNGFNIANGNKDATNSLVLGRSYPQRNEFANFAIWELVFLDHDATEEELTKIKDYFIKTYPWLFPDQAWTVTGKTNEDEDRATIANITGNGNDLVLSNFGFAEGSGYGLYAYNFNSFNLRDNVVKPTDVKKDSFRMIGTGNSNNVLILLNESDSADWKIRITGMKEGDRCLIGNANKSGEYISVTKDGTYTFQKQYAANATNGIWYNSSQEVDVLVEQIPEYEGYLVTDGVDDIASSNTFVYEADFTFIGEWKFIQKDDTVAGINSSSHLYIQNRYNRGTTVMINSSSENKKNITDYMTFKAITSKGKAYDENWNEVDLLYGDGFNDPSAGLNIGGQGSSDFCHMLFKNMALYMNKVFSKDDCIKAYNYLQTLKAK